MAILRANKLGTTSSSLTAQSSLTLTVTATTTAKNRIIVAAMWQSQDPTVTVTDSKGNTYGLDCLQKDGAAGASAVFSGRADSALTSGVDTITITWTGAKVDRPKMAAYEYAGLADFAPVDQVLSAHGSSTSPNSGSVTTEFANELIFGLVTELSTDTITAHSYTELDQVVNTTTLETQENIVTATGSYAVTATLFAGQSWNSIIVTYADTSNATLNQPGNLNLPEVTGSGVVGMQLTCSEGTWTNSPTAYAYQWKRDGTSVSTGAHYLVTTADVGHVLSCVVTASNKFAAVAATSSNTIVPSVKSISTGLGI